MNSTKKKKKKKKSREQWHMRAGVSSVLRAYWRVGHRLRDAGRRQAAGCACTCCGGRRFDQDLHRIVLSSALLFSSLRYHGRSENL